jgi:Protein of unknown function (DUF2946)
MVSWDDRKGWVLLMRRRLRIFLPIVLMALTVQILAPIGACWAASIAAADPLQAAVICHGDAASAPGQADQTGQPRAHDGACSLCSVVQAGASVDTPQTAVGTPYRLPERVVWLDRAPDLFGSRPGSHAQARAPPQMT